MIPSAQVFGAPVLVPQQSAGMRVLRLVLASTLLVGWWLDALRPTVEAAAGQWSWHWSGLVPLVTLVVLIAGPQPRFATKWAWFWLIGAGPMSAVFLLAEPVPVWQAEPAVARPSRLTGGWGFVVSLLAGAVFSAVAALTVTPWLDLVRAGPLGFVIP